MERRLCGEGRYYKKEEKEDLHSTYCDSCVILIAFSSINSFIPLNNTISSILQMRKMRHRQSKWPSLCHMAGKWWSWELSPSWQLQGLFSTRLSEVTSAHKDLGSISVDAAQNLSRTKYCIITQCENGRQERSEEAGEWRGLVQAFWPWPWVLKTGERVKLHLSVT